MMNPCNKFILLAGLTISMSVGEVYFRKANEEAEYPCERELCYRDLYSVNVSEYTGTTSTTLFDLRIKEEDR